MKCPFCGSENMSGVDDCEYCAGNLSSLDGIVPVTKIEKVLVGDPITKLRPRAASVIEAKSNALDAVRLMNREKVGCVLVTQQAKVVGILTERDIVFKVLAKKKRPADMLVEMLMTPSPDVLTDEDTLAVALNEMSVGGYRHIPISRKGKLDSIISVRDVLKYLAKLFPETAR